MCIVRWRNGGKLQFRTSQEKEEIEILNSKVVIITVR